MSVTPVNNAQVIVGSVDASPFTGDITTTARSVKQVSQNVFAAKGFTVVRPAVKEGKFGLNGYADHSATGWSTLMYDALATQTAYSVGVPATDAMAAGDFTAFGRGVVLAYTPLSATLDAAGGFMLDMGNDTAAVSGLCAAPLASRTTSGLTGTALALTGPSATQRLYACLQVTAAAGTNLAVKIQSDTASNFPSPTDRITFSTVSAVGWQFSSVAGDLSTETYWRAVATIASSTFSFAVSIGVA